MEESHFPLPYQIACIILTALFILSFSISREPRQWRRLFQSMFQKETPISVNRNKVIDEKLKTYGIAVAMIFLVADVAFFVAGITYQDRVERGKMTAEELYRIQEQNRIQGSAVSRGTAGP
jgi:flagellar biosynthesis protein FlhB